MRTLQRVLGLWWCPCLLRLQLVQMAIGICKQPSESHRKWITQWLCHYAAVVVTRRHLEHNHVLQSVDAGREGRYVPCPSTKDAKRVPLQAGVGEWCQ
jgi:hypothetical protein